MTAASVAEVADLYARWGDHHYDEEVTQLSHALQTAALAAQAGASDALVAAALLHDVGHLLDVAELGGHRSEDGRDLAHEARGARYLAGLFPPSVTAPIALHVKAKRYRCAVDPAAEAALSDGSRASLVLQGGPMDEAEVQAFAAHPSAADALALRAWDDGGKLDDLEVPAFGSYLPLLERVARTR